MTTIKNQYEITATLGKGGFGETYLAKDTHMPRATVRVIKKLAPQSSDPKTLEAAEDLFAREAEILDQLGKEHQCIPTLYAYFSENQQFYIVQEFIDGQDLEQEWQSGKEFSEAEIIAMLDGVLAILQFIHGRGVIHRDLKPSNLIRRRQDNQIVLIDFGAVKQVPVLETTHSGGQCFTRAIGSPGYMAMEQQRGQPTFASDLYSLGMTALFLLTGQQPTELINQDLEVARLAFRWGQSSIGRSFAENGEELTQRPL